MNRTEVAVVKEQRAWRKRCLRFLRKGTDDPNIDDTEPPRKMHRKKARCALLRLDNAVRASCGFGLSYFRVPKKEADRDPDPVTWPRLSLVRDEGPDMAAGAAWLKRAADINLDDVQDLNHGEWNSMRSALKHTGLWGHMLVFAVVANVDYGPYQSDSWFHSLRGAWQEYCKTADPSSCPLLAEHLDGILADRGEGEKVALKCIERTVFKDTCHLKPVVLLLRSS